MIRHLLNLFFRRKKNEDEKYDEDVKSKDMRHNSDRLRERFKGNLDFLERTIDTGDFSYNQASLFYFSSLTDEAFTQKNLIEPLLALDGDRRRRGEQTKVNLQILDKAMFAVSTLKTSANFETICSSLQEGFVAIFLEGEQEALLVHAPRNLSRGIEEAVNEFVSRGPRDGFAEDIQLNLGLIRKRLKGAQLEARQFVIGDKSRTTCALLFLNDIAKSELVERMNDKLLAVRTDAIFESGQLEELLHTHAFSIFDEYMNTERPDKVAAELLEGRVAIIVDGSPTVLIGPATFFNLLSAPDDYYQRFIPATIHRFLRFGGFMLSAHLSALYLSLVTYHAHLIPIKLVEILMSKREQVPFPPLFEILLMQVMIDLILEAILRLPTKLGQIIGVAGAIVIGQAAISANLISPGVIIVVSFTTIAGFAMPRLSTGYSVQILRYVNLILVSLFGGFGLMVSVMFWMIQLCHLHPLGKAYLSPLSPFKWQDMRDMIFRFPKWMMSRQPDNPGGQTPLK